MSEHKRVRVGLIGLGGVGKHHATALTSGDIENVRLTAVCDTEMDHLSLYPSLARFTDYRELHRSDEVDAVLIAAPHGLHAAMTIDALEMGLHVLVEKPIALHLAEGQRMVQAHKNPAQVFGVMLNQRTDPCFRKAKELLDAGKLGTIQRVNWICTHWYRPETYYKMAPWRGTWEGEGGGLLMTLCLHELDILQWLCGMPSRVRSFCAFGKYHHIEVEDDVTAYFEYDNGATGLFVGTSGESPGTNRLEIIGDKGCLIAENRGLTFKENAISTREFSHTASDGWSRPAVTNTHFEFDDKGGQHAEIIRNFGDAILNGAPLIASGAEGLCALELADAILYSSFINDAVTMPLDAAAFEVQLKKRMDRKEKR